MSATMVASPAAGGVVPLDPVRALQHTLYRTAKADSGRRFHALGDKIIRSDVLWRAWFQVYRNQAHPTKVPPACEAWRMLLPRANLDSEEPGQ